LRQAFGVRWPDTALLVFCFGIRLLAMGDASISLAKRGDPGHGHGHWTLGYVFTVDLQAAPVLSNIPELPGCPVETPCPSASRGLALLTGSSFVS